MIAKSQPLNVRLPHGMRDRIRERAAQNRRSMNAEIVHYLDRALDGQEAKGPAEVAASPSHVTHTNLPA
nr:Arc family DNA-binding protein [Aminobacter aminovorans]